MGSSGPYAATHFDPQGAGDARPTALQIIQDEGVKGKLAGKVVVITGATSGIGIETARALSATGATLFLTARNRSKAEKNLAGILEPGRVSLIDMNLERFASIRAGAEEILTASKGQVNLLINGAGVMGLQNHTLTRDGIEAQFAGNYLGFFLLFQLLKQALLASVTPELNSRVVVVASSAHRAATLPASDNYNFEKGGYNHEHAYNNAKLAAVYLANTIERLYGAQGLHSTSLHPGAINTDISRNMPPEFLEGIMTNPYILKILKSTEQGAATTVWAAVGKEWEGKGGKYLEDCKEADRGQDDGQTFNAGWVKQTYNPMEEDRLWKDSLKMVGLESEV
ncbi:Short-chain dehydrogenase/reductase SDR [Penicillium canescens]|uniref:Short-chain dehydrogenase/reductase SDR n=1 Tax=Penicillium canescens TaxID=5083 RepID=A0AAD6NBL9_PENCN|nr:Short-chain dehydrogenase/reductase SDR [Penicillium canescens]KAJ6051195.1 Short-chain dehydrogenase/reductase SDR [Penicillium canescens]KAJ6061706.1 Short-chain dehydrogenase/reductase SDR [Penicillium canescens]KAJ6064954.1 Short-chain dehydrogenase/reductase SDR [Penicillium canescens]KAJ6183275.1 Short-chain dehydrogenase/reductase SDR [Penicillium canescens]